MTERRRARERRWRDADWHPSEAGPVGDTGLPFHDLLAAADAPPREENPQKDPGAHRVSDRHGLMKPSRFPSESPAICGASGGAALHRAGARRPRSRG